MSNKHAAQNSSGGPNGSNITVPSGINNFPLYNELLKLPPAEDYSKEKIVNMWSTISSKEEMKDIHEIFFLIIYHHTIYKETVWGKKKQMLPYDGKAAFGGVFFTIDKLPDDLCELLYRFILSVCSF